MAEFKGSVQEFHHFIGPRIRNLINNFTRLHRNQRQGTCEFCGIQAVLQSAHIHGRDRRTIIENVLSAYRVNLENVTCDIKKVENEILSAHEPINETFKFICQPCHTQYDATSIPEMSVENTQARNKEFTKLGRVRLWARRPNQTNHQIISAFLELETNGDVKVDDFRNYCGEQYNITNFDQHFASMKTDNGNSHGKVFFVENGEVKIWQIVRVEIEEYFPHI
tara:strand:- start:91893 stop:92561 length:669 start_codon:yes stop_codon:yes gene_type:complete